jgi:D-galactarolactone isomerase
MDWSRREVLTTLSLTAAAGLVGGSPRKASAQAVKWSAGTEAPKLKAPANAVDCHHHIYNSKYPVDPKAMLRPADATVEDYRALQKRIGTSRNVLVQPSTYGTDNRAHLEALAAFGPSARMVAVVDDTVTTEELKRLHGLGVRGIRFNLARPAPPRPR